MSSGTYPGTASGHPEFGGRLDLGVAQVRAEAARFAAMLRNLAVAFPDGAGDRDMVLALRAVEDAEHFACRHLWEAGRR